METKDLADYDLNELVEYETGKALFKIAKGVSLKEILYSMALIALQWKAIKDGEPPTDSADEMSHLQNEYDKLAKHHNKCCTCLEIY